MLKEETTTTNRWRESIYIYVRNCQPGDQVLLGFSIFKLVNMDHQVCLRWNNFHSSLASTLEILWDEESFCDVTLFCEGEEIRAHKVVLSACSLTFKSLLRNNVCQHPIVILHDIRLNILEAILQFIYKGEVNIEQDQLNGLLRAATSLQIKGLAGVRNEEEKEVQTDSQKKTKKTYCENSNVRSHNLIPKRKKPKVSLPLTENVETTLVSPKEELCSEEEAYNIVSYNNDDEQESDDLVRHERAADGSDCNNHEDPLVTNANTNVPQDYTNPAEFLPNSSQGICFLNQI